MHRLRQERDCGGCPVLRAGSGKGDLVLVRIPPLQSWRAYKACEQFSQLHFLAAW